MGTVDYGINDLNNTPLWNLIQEKINSVDLQWEDGTASSLEGRQEVHNYRADTRMPDEVIPQQESTQRYDVRKSKVSCLNDSYLTEQLSYSINLYNKQHWNYDLNGTDEIQYGIYSDGGYYDWHVDHEKKTPNIDGKFLVRKLSTTIWLNDPDEYEGGEFDIEIHAPYKNPRYDTLKLPKGSIIIFRSDRWHRVRPVTSGVRKSLVTWFRGSPFR